MDLSDLVDVDYAPEQSVLMLFKASESPVVVSRGFTSKDELVATLYRVIDYLMDAVTDPVVIDEAAKRVYDV